MKKTRVAIATFFIAAVTLLFLDYTGTTRAYLAWCAKAQFVPALFAFDAAVVIGLVLLTLLAGRVYCSMICPLGIFQDAVSRVAGKNRFAYRPPKKAFVIARYSIFAIFTLSAILGVTAIIALLEPYGAYGRVATQIAGPIYKYGNNLLAWLAKRADSYAFFAVNVWVKGAGALLAAMLTFSVVGAFAWKSGRGYCNTVCPVGALLGVLAKFALVKPRINKEKCVACGLCANNCKAGCIDANRGEIDHTRCVSCFNCTDVCPGKAAIYAPRPLTATTQSTGMKNESLFEGDLARRNLILGAAAFLLGLVFRSTAARAAGTYQFDGGVAPLKDKIAPNRKNPIIPPGADSVENFRKLCIGCQLCVSACPNHVLLPSGKMSELMQPYRSYERGYCRPECVKCTEVCPTGALKPITVEEKAITQFGGSVWNKDLCVVNVDKAPCDLCARKCPTTAIKMTPLDANDEASLKIPVIDADRCIGCGACEHLCPARPLSAIHVDGITEVRRIKPPPLPLYEGERPSRVG